MARLQFTITFYAIILAVLFTTVKLKPEASMAHGLQRKRILHWRKHDFEVNSKNNIYARTLKLCSP